MTARLSDALLPAGLVADLPADPGIVPAFYSATDTGQVWRWDGTTWVLWALALPEGTADGDVPVWDDTAGLWVPGTGGGGGGGALLASMSYNPAETATNAATSDTDIDATNIAVSFVAPASGIVLVRGALMCLAAASATTMMLTLREGTTQLGKARVLYGASMQLRVQQTWRISGLTAGSAHTYKLGGFAGVTGPQWGRGGDLGPATMEVWQA